MSDIRIECWSVVSSYTNPYEAPELRKNSLRGQVYGHPMFPDGHMVVTSIIDMVEDNTIVTYSGNRYKLGEVDPEYEKLFPNARERIFKKD